MQIFDGLYEVGGVRLKPPDGSGPDRTPHPPQYPVRSGPHLVPPVPPTQDELAGGEWPFWARISAIQILL